MTDRWQPEGHRPASYEPPEPMPNTNVGSEYESAHWSDRPIEAPRQAASEYPRATERNPNRNGVFEEPDSFYHPQEHRDSRPSEFDHVGSVPQQYRSPRPPETPNVSVRLGQTEPSAVTRPLEIVTSASGPYLTFGPEARLKPIPVKPIAPQVRSYETARDTALDWLDDKLGQIRAASVRGHIHRYSAEIRQDSFALARGTNYLALAVSDGVGSAKAAHLGSACASQAIVESEVLLGDVVSAKVPGEVSLRDIATLLRSVASDHGVDASDVSTTLTVAVVLETPSRSGETSVVIAQIGDSPAFRLSRGEWIELRCPVSDERRGDLIDNSVEPLPGHHTASVWVETFAPGESLFLVSDGVSDPVKSNGDYARALGALWRSDAPSPADLLKVLDATVKSFDDDRTLVGIRFGTVLS